MKVKITSVPPGGAPLHIKQAWVGLELPLIEGELEPGVFRSVTGGRPNPKSFGGFPVKTVDAIQALRDAGKEEAAEWWEQWFLTSGGTGKTLVFAATSGELVQEQGHIAVAEPMHRVAAMTAANKRAKA